MKKQGKKGISTVFGAVFFIILIFALQTTLFLAVYRYNNSIQEAIKTENERIQERIVLTALKTENSTGVENIQALMINNTGTITTRIRAIYIDNQFLCDPSDKNINPEDTYLNPKGTSWILMPPGVPYNQTSKITAATERGTRTTDYEWKLNQAKEGIPPYEPHRFYLGPLMLDFTKFYYTEVDPKTGEFISPVEWKPGWSVDAGTGYIAWNITVKNIDNRNITINQFSVFTLWANDQPSNRLPWYIELPPNSLTQRINSNKNAQIIYKWTTPKTDPAETPNPQKIYNVGTGCRCRTFLTFFGIFHEHDGTTKPYGQTIPFEAVLVGNPTNVTVTASPTVIAINSPMNSTITARVMIGHNPVVGANVTFTTTAGDLSSPWAITDATGTATVYLTAGTTLAVATVTATWKTISGSTTVRFETAKVQVAASPTVIVIQSTMNSTINAVVMIGADPVVGAEVTFTTTAGDLSSSWAITDATGTATVYLTARWWTSPENATVTATWTTISGSTTVLFTVETVQVTTSPSVIATNSIMKSTITAVVMVGEYPVVGANVTFTTTAGNLSSPWAITDGTGVASIYLNAPMSPAIAQVTAIWINTLGSTTVRFTNLYVTTDRQSYAQNDTVKISGLLRDVDGAPIQGVVVSLDITALNGTVIWSVNSTQTDSNGAFTYDLQLINATPDTYTIIAKYQDYSETCTFTVM